MNTLSEDQLDQGNPTRNIIQGIVVEETQKQLVTHVQNLINCTYTLTEGEIKGVLWPIISEYLIEIEKWIKISEEKNIFLSLFLIPITILIALVTSDFNKFGQFSIIVTIILCAIFLYSLYFSLKVLFSITEHFTLSPFRDFSSTKPSDKKMVDKIIKDLKKLRPDIGQRIPKKDQQIMEEIRSMVKNIDKESRRKETKDFRKKYHRFDTRRNLNFDDNRE